MAKSSGIRVLVGTCLLTFAGAALAGTPSSVTEQRGYNNCVKAAERQLPGLSVDSTYFTNTYADAREFYLNGRANREGAWGSVRINCETSRSGHRVLTMNQESGRFVGRKTVTVAQN